MVTKITLLKSEVQPWEVRYTKHFITGVMQGVSVKETVPYATYEAASVHFVRYTETEGRIFKSFTGSEYTVSGVALVYCGMVDPALVSPAA